MRLIKNFYTLFYRIKRLKRLGFEYKQMFIAQYIVSTEKCRLEYTYKIKINYLLIS